MSENNKVITSDDDRLVIDQPDQEVIPLIATPKESELLTFSATPEQMETLAKKVQAGMEEELKSEALLGLDQIPISFATVDELIAFVNNMQFLDENLQPYSKRVDKISTDNPEGILQFNRELWVAQRLFTIQSYYNQKPGFYQDRFKKVILKGERADMPLGIIERYGMHMSEIDWDIYLEGFSRLFNLFTGFSGKLTLKDIPGSVDVYGQTVEQLAKSVGEAIDNGYFATKIPLKDRRATVELSGIPEGLQSSFPYIDTNFPQAPEVEFKLAYETH